MALKFTSAKSAEAYIKKFAKQKHDRIVNRLHFAGQRFVAYARTKTRNEGQYSRLSVKTKKKSFIFKENHIYGPGGGTDENSPGFFDWTSNLRNSIGYMIVYNGQVLDNDFQSNDGYNFASSLMARIPSDCYALICVAGMEYASYVEAKGYDVITGGSIVLTRDLKKIFE